MSGKSITLGCIMSGAMLSFTDECLEVEWLPPAEAVARVAEGRLLLVDVRTRREVDQTGLAAGALHIPLADLPEAAPGGRAEEPALAAAQAVALYCATGVRSQIAGGLLRSRGMAEVYNLGGLRDWLEAGGRLARPGGEAAGRLRARA